MNLTFSSLLLALAGILPVTANLLLEVTGPKIVVDAENFVVTALLTNTGEDTLTFLHDPRTILTTYETEVFDVTNVDRGGKSPKFIGIRVKWSPDYMTVEDKGSYTILEPSQTTTWHHNLGNVFDFSESGEGTYDIVPRVISDLSIVEADSNGKFHPKVGAEDIVVAVKKHTVKFSGKLVNKNAPLFRFQSGEL